MSAHTTRAPFLGEPQAEARPTPDPAPVTIATLSSSSMLTLTLLLVGCTSSMAPVGQASIAALMLLDRNRLAGSVTTPWFLSWANVPAHT